MDKVVEVEFEQIIEAAIAHAEVIEPDMDSEVYLEGLHAMQKILDEYVERAQRRLRAEGCSSCQYCGQTIAWFVTEQGTNMPINADGTNHFATCPWRQQAKRQDREARARSYWDGKRCERCGGTSFLVERYFMRDGRESFRVYCANCGTKALGIPPFTQDLRDRAIQASPGCKLVITAPFEGSGRLVIQNWQCAPFRGASACVNPDGTTCPHYRGLHPGPGAVFCWTGKEQD
jgi:hypothetical protein